MNSRQRLHAVMNYQPGVAPPRFERQFSDEVIARWRELGYLPAGISPHQHFRLDADEEDSVEWGRSRDDKRVVARESDLHQFRAAYDPATPNRLPHDYVARGAKWLDRECAFHVAPWSEGFFQILGIRDGASLSHALTLLCEQPHLAEAQMEHYTAYLEALIDRALEAGDADYGVYYEPIASPYGTVISPETYRYFVQPHLARIIERLTRIGIRWHVVWCSGRVDPMIPLWLDAGINGLILHQANESGMQYRNIRKRYGRDLRLFGGVDWRAVYRGRAEIDRQLEKTVVPLIEDGGYIPHLDDTVRAYMPFEHYAYFRERLDTILDDLDKSGSA